MPTLKILKHVRKYINIQESIATGDEASQAQLAFGLGRELWKTLNVDPGE